MGKHSNFMNDYLRNEFIWKMASGTKLPQTI